MLAFMRAFVRTCPHSRHHASRQSISTLCSNNIATQQLSSAFANNLNCHPQYKSLYLHRFPATSPCPHPPSNRARKEVCISPPAPPAAETAAAEPQQEQGKGSAAASRRQQQLITSQAGPVLTTSAQLGTEPPPASRRMPPVGLGPPPPVCADFVEESTAPAARLSRMFVVNFCCWIEQLAFSFRCSYLKYFATQRSLP